MTRLLEATYKPSVEWILFVISANVLYRLGTQQMRVEQINRYVYQNYYRQIRASECIDKSSGRIDQRLFIKIAIFDWVSGSNNSMLY